jgi:DNA-directed RNA polymerase specialized sigma24 family protein
VTLSVPKSLSHPKWTWTRRQGCAGFLEKEASEDLEALDEALTKLEAEDPAKAELVKLRFFAGLTMPEIAQVLKISLATAERHWTYARTSLFAELKDRGNSARPGKNLPANEGFGADSSH